MCEFPAIWFERIDKVCVNKLPTTDHRSGTDELTDGLKAVETILWGS